MGNIPQSLLRLGAPSSTSLSKSQKWSIMTNVSTKIGRGPTKCHSIKLNMGEYLLDSLMISIQMGGVDVVLEFQWLQSSGIMALNFQYLFIIFSS
jgi:hypothetical protein